MNIPFFYGVQPAAGGNPAFVYGVFFNNPCRPLFKFNVSSETRYSFEAGDGRMDYFFIGGGAGHTMPKVIDRYSELTGRPTMLPKWGLGHHLSRFSYDNQAWVEYIANQATVDDIPARCRVPGSRLHGRECRWQHRGRPDPAARVQLPVLEPGGHGQLLQRAGREGGAADRAVAPAGRYGPLHGRQQQSAFHQGQRRRHRHPQHLHRRGLVVRLQQHAHEHVVAEPDRELVQLDRVLRHLERPDRTGGRRRDSVQRAPVGGRQVRHLEHRLPALVVQRAQLLRPALRPAELQHHAGEGFEQAAVRVEPLGQCRPAALRNQLERRHGGQLVLPAGDHPVRHGRDDRGRGLVRQRRGRLLGHALGRTDGAVHRVQLPHALLPQPRQQELGRPRAVALQRALQEPAARPDQASLQADALPLHARLSNPPRPASR